MCRLFQAHCLDRQKHRSAIVKEKGARIIAVVSLTACENLALSIRITEKQCLFLKLDLCRFHPISGLQLFAVKTNNFAVIYSSVEELTIDVKSLQQKYGIIEEI